MCKIPSLHDLKTYLEKGLITVQKHLEEDLCIYNYTSKCQYNAAWDEVTSACRGLILDKNGALIARPFPKFFNLHEHDPKTIPNSNFEVFEKLDGSLGILYFWKNKDQMQKAMY